MRIAHMIDLLNWGGAQKLEVTFAQAARARGLDFTVISLRRDKETPIPGELGALGAHVVTFPASSLFDPVRVWRIARFLRRERFDILQTHLVFSNILGTLAGRLAGIPVIGTLHSIGFDARHDHPFKQQLEAFALRYGAAHIVAVGQSIADAHRARLGNRALAVIPNAVTAPISLAPRQRNELRAQMVGAASKTILIAVGRLSPPKDYPVMIAAFANLRLAHPHAALVIVGDGVLRDDIAAQVASLGLNDCVHLLGARNDVPSLLAASDAYVLSSNYEGLPLTLLEAMSTGLPVVATTVGEVPRVAVRGAAILVPPRDPDALANALRDLLDNPAKMRALGEVARMHIAHNYGANAWLDQLLALYLQVVNSTHEVRESRESSLI